MKTLHILLLEDSPIDAELTLATLDRGDIAYTVRRVETREDFTAALADDTLDLILADYALPTFDGISALRIANRVRPDLPFIFVSGTLGEELAIDMLKNGATDYVLKQRLARLVPAVERAMRENKERSELKQAASALRHSEEAFRLLVESVRDYAIIMLDAHGTIIGWNSGAHRILGYSDEEIIGKDFACIFTPDQVAEGLPAREIRQAAETGRAEEDRWHLRKDGSKFWASGVLTPMQDDTGRLYGFAKVMRDITERRRAEMELMEAKELAEAANRAKDQFLAVLSHELRTPLTPVLATVHALEEQPDLSEESRFLIGIIHRNIELEAHLIDDLLDLTRISKDKFQLNLEMVDVHELIRTVIEVSSPDLGTRKLGLRTALQARHHLVRADATRLQQVLRNLIRNAIKFTPDEGVITVATRDDGKGMIQIEVSDTGIGIDGDLLPRIFEAFEQGEQTLTRRYGGLGLGLAISKALIDMHGGLLSATSAGKDRGATFVIELATDPSGSDVDCSGVGSNEQTRPRKDIRILLVDDHEDTGKVMKLLLDREGYDVMMARDIGSALTVASEAPFELLISDIGLPDGTGFELLQRVRELRPVPGIALSGFGMPEDLRKSEEAGFARHLTKPVSFHRLLEAIEAVTDRK